MADPNTLPKLFLLIPVFNEAGNISQLLDCLEAFAEELKDQYNVQLVLINDGSRDETEQLARHYISKYPRYILNHSRNQGPGSAFGTGFEAIAAKFSDNDIVVTMEGDNTSRLELLKQMFHRMEEGFDVILASPYLYGGAIVHTSVFRIFLSSMANLFVKELLGIHGIFTVSSFYRMYRVPILRKLQTVYGPRILERTGFECMTEMLMKMIYLDAKISEVAMVLDTKLRVGRSHMKIRRTILGYYALWRLQDKWQKMTDSVLHPARDGAETSPLGVRPVGRA